MTTSHVIREPVLSLKFTLSKVEGPVLSSSKEPVLSFAEGKGYRNCFPLFSKKMALI